MDTDRTAPGNQTLEMQQAVGWHRSQALNLRIALLLVAALLLPRAVAAQENGDPHPTTRSLRILSIGDGQIDVDGYLNEDAWQAAQVATGFTQREPDDGSPATETTEVRVLYAGGAIYIGVRAFDSAPEEIRTQLARRDGRAQADEIAIYFDSYYDRRTSFEFAVTPRGSIRDVYRSSDSFRRRDASWDPVWEVEATIDSLGWTAEFRIPLTQLRFDRQGTTWGFQVYRRIERKAEEVWWAPWSKESSGFTSWFGTLEGLANLPSLMRLEVRPYTVANSRHRPEGTGTRYVPATEAQFDGGVDIKYGLTSDFTLDLTVNPDFGQVEADPAVVNLTAFESFFPERRPFFVEGGGLFNRFVQGGQMFYSRRIGRRPQGFASAPTGGTVQMPDASTIVSAAKATGKSASGLGLGLMSALTTGESATLRDPAGVVVGSEDVEPWTHYFAGRVEQDFKEGSHTVGSMVTAVNRSLGGNFDFLRSAAYVAEVDGEHKWQRNTYNVSWQFTASHIRGSPNAITSAQRSPFRYFQRPDADHVDLDSTRTTLSGYSLGVSAGKEAGTWRYFSYFSRVSAGFDINDMGFQFAADRQDVGGGLQYVQVRPRWIFRNFRLGLNFAQAWTSGGEATGTWIRPVWFNATFKNNWAFDVNPIAVRRNRLSVTLLRGGPALKQNTWRQSWINVGTDRRKPVSLRVRGTIGGIFGTPERWSDLRPSFDIRPSGLVTANVGIRYSWRRNPIQWVGRRVVNDSTRYILGSIEQRTLRLTTRLDVTLSRDLSIQFYGQPFVSAGEYSDFKEVIAPRADRFEDRFRVYDDELTCTDGSCDVDLDGDGAADLSFGQPDFNFKQLRSTMVFRWEYRPGSVLFLAWQHGRDDFLPDGSFGGVGDLTDLFSLDADNTFLVKVNYWLGF